MPTSMEKWQAAMQPAAVVAFFHGMFDRAGVRVTDTGEAFTCRHAGERIEFADGIDEAAVDFTVEIQSAQVDRMLDDVRGGALDAGAQYRIMAEIAGPATRAALKRPMIRSRLLRSVLFKIGRVDALMHVRLVAPPGEPEAEGSAYTLAYVDGQTLVIPGLHGRVRHSYHLTVADAAEYQRRMFRARRSNKIWSWLLFARWYGKLRRRVVVPSTARQAM